MVTKLLSFFLGFLFSSLLDTTISEFHEWSIVSAGFIVAFIEFVNKIYFYLCSKMIKSGIEHINENPALYGHSRPDIPERYRSHQVGEHSIIYRLDENKIFIVAILHGSMDFRSRLQ